MIDSQVISVTIKIQSSRKKQTDDEYKDITNARIKDNAQTRIRADISIDDA